MENKKVMVESMVDNLVSINLPELNFKRTWEKKGAKKPVDLDILKEAIYSTGVEYMFQQGILYIDDMAVKIELGLEPENADKPQNIIVLDDKQKRRLLTLVPLAEFKSTLSTLPREQINSLIDFAIVNELMDADKDAVLKKMTGIDIIRSIQLNQQDKED